jgi:hypothetical protein
MGRLRAPAPTAVSPALSYKSTTSIATAIYEPPSPMPAIPTLFDSNSTSDTTSRMLKTPSKLDGVLAWSVFRRTWPSCGLASDENWKENPGEDVHLDPVSVRTLRELYLERFHPSYPIINIDILDKAIHSTFEGAQGCRWGSESCLMLLVCALGAVADDYRDHFYNRGSATDLQRSRVERITMAEGYWFMAQRRLGCVLSEESELAGQCLALAG